MIKNIKDKKLNITIKDEKINLPEALKETIKEYWDSIQNEGSNIWNGEVTCVLDIQEIGETVEITCIKSDYAHYIYGERVGLPKEYECRNISAGALIQTKDNYYFIGELDKTTSYPYMLQTSGGNVDKKDINNGKVDIMQTISREVMEELNINIKDKNIVKKCELEYLYLSEPDEQPGTEIFAKVELDMTHEELQLHFNEYLKYLKTNGLEIEFGKIHFLKRDSSIEELEKLKNPKRNYWKPLLKEDTKER